MTKFYKNNIEFEIRENDGKFELWIVDVEHPELKGIYATEKEAYSNACMIERITVPFTVFDF